MLNSGKGVDLLKLARQSIEDVFEGRETTYKGKEFSEKVGVFVSLHENGKLRG